MRTIELPARLDQVKNAPQHLADLAGQSAKAGSSGSRSFTCCQGLVDIEHKSRRIRLALLRKRCFQATALSGLAA